MTSPTPLQIDYRSMVIGVDEALCHAEDCHRCLVRLLLMDALVKAGECGDPIHGATRAWFEAREEARTAFTRYAADAMRPFQLDGASPELLFRILVAWSAAYVVVHDHPLPPSARQ